MSPLTLYGSIETGYALYYSTQTPRYSEERAGRRRRMVRHVESAIS
jgi:hypothetical protein